MTRFNIRQNAALTCSLAFVICACGTLNPVAEPDLDPLWVHYIPDSRASTSWPCAIPEVERDETLLCVTLPDTILRTSDGMVLAYGRALPGILAVAGPEACANFLFGREGGIEIVAGILADQHPSLLWAMQSAALDRPPPADRENTYWSGVSDDIWSQSGRLVLELVFERNIDRGAILAAFLDEVGRDASANLTDMSETCRLGIAFYERLVALPTATAIALLRLEHREIWPRTNRQIAHGMDAPRFRPPPPRSPINPTLVSLYRAAPIYAKLAVRLWNRTGTYAYNLYFLEQLAEFDGTNARDLIFRSSHWFARASFQHQLYLQLKNEDALSWRTHQLQILRELMDQNDTACFSYIAMPPGYEAVLGDDIKRRIDDGFMGLVAVLDQSQAPYRYGITPNLMEMRLLLEKLQRQVLALLEIDRDPEFVHTAETPVSRQLMQDACTYTLRLGEAMLAQPPADAATLFRVAALFYPFIRYKP